MLALRWILLTALLLGVPQPSHATTPPDPNAPVCAADISSAAAALSAAQAIQLLDRDGDVVELVMELCRYFPDIGLPVASGPSLPLPVGLIQAGDQSLLLLLSAYARGIQDAIVPQQLPALRQRLAAALRLGPADADLLTSRVLARLQQAANDPEIFLRLIQSELNGSLGGTVRWSDLFLKLPAVVHHIPRLLMLRHPAWPTVPFVMARPQQVMLAQSVYGNTSTRRGDKVLELGYGSPIVLTVLASVIPGITLTGVDPQPIPATANDLLARLKIHLLQGNFPSDAGTMRTLRERGPYAIIYAGDAIFPGIAPGTSSAEYVKALYDLCAENGSVVILNDFARAPRFTEAEARGAGFTIVRWNASRRMPQPAIDATKLAVGLSDAPLLGELRLFVLRKGNVDESRIRIAPLTTAPPPPSPAPAPGPSTPPPPPSSP